MNNPKQPKMSNEEIEQRAAERFPYMSNDMPERVRTLSLRQAYITGYQQASGEGWVSVETPPENRDPVLCCNAFGYMEVMWYSETAERFIQFHNGEVWPNNLTAPKFYQPLPQPPKTI